MIVSSVKFNINPIKFSPLKTPSFKGRKYRSQPQEDSFESTVTLKREEKIQIFREAGATKKQIGYIIKKPEVYSDKIIWYISRQVPIGSAIELCDSNTKHNQRIYSLVKQGMAFESTNEIVDLDQKTYAKAFSLQDSYSLKILIVSRRWMIANI